jgi:hypothetical protein
MKRLHLSIATALAVLAGTAWSDEAEKPKKADDPFAAMAKLAAPGPNHKVLGSLAGTWETKVKFWMNPDKDPMESEGVMVRKWILGGRFLQETYHQGDPKNPTFAGRGLLGYDNSKKKYTAMWVDSMSTGISTSLGTYDKEKNTFTFTSEGVDPYTGNKMKSRDVFQVVDADHTVSEMFKQSPNGKEIKVLEIKYTRKK